MAVKPFGHIPLHPDSEVLKRRFDAAIEEYGPDQLVAKFLKLGNFRYEVYEVQAPWQKTPHVLHKNNSKMLGILSNGSNLRTSFLHP